MPVSSTSHRQTRNIDASKLSGKLQRVYAPSRERWTHQIRFLFVFSVRGGGCIDVPAWHLKTFWFSFTMWHICHSSSRDTPTRNKVWAIAAGTSSVSRRDSRREILRFFASSQPPHRRVWYGAIVLFFLLKSLARHQTVQSTVGRFTTQAFQQLYVNWTVHPSK